ncbi:MAG: hypothetical protein L0214_07855 [candidate division NC10 bacterium]|nr:hypothetical protein [candidate division NC10 bacterium]
MPSRPIAPPATPPRAWPARRYRSLLAAALLGVAIGAAAGTIRGDLFRDERYRIQVTKPASWHFVPGEQASSRAREALPEGVRSGQASAATLLVAVSEVPPGTPTRYPGRVTVAVEDLTGRPGVETLELYAQANLRTLGNLLQEFRLEGPSERVRAGGVAGLRVEYSGVVLRPEGPVAIRGVALHFLRGRTGYAIAAVAAAEAFAARRATLQQILASVSFLP